MGCGWLGVPAGLELGIIGKDSWSHHQVDLVGLKEADEEADDGQGDERQGIGGEPLFWIPPIKNRPSFRGTTVAALLDHLNWTFRVCQGRAKGAFPCCRSCGRCFV